MQNSYDNIAEQWHAHVREQTYVDRVLGYVDQVLEGLPPGARVLDLGCGTGNLIARYIVRRGYRVIGVDQSEKMLEIAKAELPEAKFIHSDMVEIEFAEKFAAAVAWDSVFHVERQYHSAIYRKLASILERGGRLLLSVGGSDIDSSVGDCAPNDSGVEGFTSEMFGHTFFYSGYAPQVARKLLEAEGFEIETWEIDDPSSRGHIAVIARKVA
ncbi:MAG TPA: methyltransferase domain-containing protein [Pyrinomonadaceae bacterium]|jgi:cyclopropane fatty-acyl-phospholipid synthase-like methyltransferase